MGVYNGVYNGLLGILAAERFFLVGVKVWAKRLTISTLRN